MDTQTAIEGFLSQRTLAVVGVSRSGKKFGNMAYRELKAKGYRLFPVHPSAERIEGDRCYPEFSALPEPVGGVVVVVPPQSTGQVVREAAAAGIRNVWLQPGAESREAIEFCAANGIQEVHGQCILMFAEPTRSYHRFHRWLWRLFGKIPK